MKIAFLGLGIMGRPMAANLANAGHEVTVWNRTPGKTVEGARAAANPAEAASGAEVVWSCVADTAAVERILFAEDGVEKALKPGMVFVDSSTISPTATLKFAERVRKIGADYVDAPVTGSKVAAESGQLIFMVGGREETLARLGPLFAATGKKVVRIGETGKGEAAKIALNLQIAMIYQGFAEGLALASKLGVEPERLVELIGSTMVRSGVFDYKASFVLRRDFSPNFPLRLMKKDVQLVRDAAREMGISLPGADTLAQVYERAAQAGLGDLDYAATLQVIDK